MPAPSTVAATTIATAPSARPGTGESVHTWADAYGIWHARVIFPHPGYSPAYLDAHTTRIRAKARRAIRREIGLRQGATPGPVRITMHDAPPDDRGRAVSITYREHTE